MSKLYTIIIISIIILLSVLVISNIKTFIKKMEDEAKRNQRHFWLSMLLALAHLVLLVILELQNNPSEEVGCFLILWLAVAMIYQDINKREKATN